MTPAGLVLMLALIAVLVQWLRLARRWAQGQSARVDWWAGIVGLPHAYLHTVHDIVARDPFASRMHAMAAGGLLAALALSLPLHLVDFARPLLAGLVLLSLVLAVLGTAMVASRRVPSRPARLSGGAYDQLPLALAGALLFVALAAGLVLLPESAVTSALWLPVVVLGALSLGWLAWSAYGGPLRHVLAGVTHLVAHPRPARPMGRADTGLRPLDLDARSLGAGRPADLEWNRLAGQDACVQCGRCETVCPAFAAGQPLNPKALINDLVRATGPGVGVPYRGSPHPGLAQVETSADAHVPFFADGEGPAILAPETLWSCTTCRACVDACPMLIEHVDAIIDIRRFLTLEQGDVPARVAATLTETRATDTASGRAPEDRLDWAVDLKLPLIAAKGEAEVLLWIGEAGFERRNQRTLRALVRLLRIAWVDFAVLGAEERDCGDQARRLGDEATFQHLARANIAALSRYRFKTILTIDPHVLQALGTEYRDFGGNFRVRHHSGFLESLFAEGRLSLADFAEPAEGTLAFHDPCYLARYNGETEAPRALLDRLGGVRVEMERHGRNTHCCGGGGGAPVADIPGKARIPDMRMDQVRATGATRLAVGCPNCMLMLEGVVGPRPEIADIAELVLERVEGGQ
jgi:Fe-S oxidoreductase